MDTDRRRRLSPYKQGDLSLLHFESALLQSLTFEDFLNVWKEKSRRLKTCEGVFDYDLYKSRCKELVVLFKV